MNEWLAAAPKAELMHGALACRLSITDWADRPPRVLANGEIIDVGGRKVRYIDAAISALADRFDARLRAALK
jgi:hypothetical protein